MTPVVNGLKADFEDAVVFLSLDAASGRGKLAFDDYGLPGHPSFVLINTEGDVTWRAFGPQSRANLQDALEGALSQ
jgi:hypothetical protein